MLHGWVILFWVQKVPIVKSGCCTRWYLMLHKVVCDVDFSCRTPLKCIFAGRHSSKPENCSWTLELIKYRFLCEGWENYVEWTKMPLSWVGSICQIAIGNSFLHLARRLSRDFWSVAAGRIPSPLPPSLFRCWLNWERQTEAVHGALCAEG
jgi:hypothetical protein